MKRTHGFLVASMIALTGFGYTYAQQERTGRTVTIPAERVRSTNVYTDVVAGTPTTVNVQGRGGRMNAVTYMTPNVMNNEVQQLLAAYENTQDGAARDEIVKSITEHVNEEFDERQAERQNELEKLEEQLTKLKETHKKRASQKDRIVKDRVQQLISNAEGLGWGPNNDGGSSAINNLYGAPAFYSVPTIAPAVPGAFSPAAPAAPTVPAAAAPSRR